MYDDVLDVRNQLSKLIEKELSKDQFIAKLEKEIDLDRHRLTKYYHVPAEH